MSATTLSSATTVVAKATSSYFSTQEKEKIKTFLSNIIQKGDLVLNEQGAVFHHVISNLKDHLMTFNASNKRSNKEATTRYNTLFMSDIVVVQLFIELPSSNIATASK